MNKYKTWYHNITENAKNRPINGYVERHHIIPRSLGGSDNKENLVDLTAREHFICHWLLTKMYTGESKSKMVYALNGMKRSNKFAQRYETKITSRVYENLKKEFSIIHSATMKGRLAHNKGVSASEEQKEKNRLAAKGRVMSPESIAKGVAKRTGQKRSVALKGKKKREGHGDAISATVATQRANGTHYSQIKIQCPYCPVKSAKHKYNAFHGDKCKHNPTLAVPAINIAN
jgi:hypothetical protein